MRPSKRWERAPISPNTPVSPTALGADIAPPRGVIPPPPRRHLQVLVFTSGAAVMAVEMAGLRLLAPYFGTSLVVTTVLIGTLMGFLSLGYSLGGRFGDRHPTLPALCKVTFAASLLVLVIPFIGQPVLQAAAAVLRPLVQGDEVSEPAVAIATIVGGILGTLAIMAGPITLLGMVSPWAIRLAIDTVEGSAKVAGRLYALSTFGSILGTFLPALVLVPALGVRDTFIAVGTVLLAVSAVGFLGGAKGALPPAGSALLLLLPTGTIRPMPGLVYEEESTYHFIQVVQEPYGDCPDAYHLYLNEGIGVHSVKCPDPQKDIRGYWTYMAAAPLWMDDPQSLRDVLIIGLAGGTMARQMLDAFPAARIDGVEIDGAVVEAGRRYFDNANPALRPIVMDGRVWLSVTDKRYDLIQIDAYRQPYIPFHLVTREFFEAVYDHLGDDGVLAVNVASVRGVSASLSAMIYRTLREVFPTVVLVNATKANDVILATRREKSMMLGADNLDKLPPSLALDSLRDRLRSRVAGPVPGWEDAQVLVDDQAPVEMAWDLMALEYAH